MEKGLKKQYGLVTAICMVVGIVIGSGVFFKAEEMLLITRGDLPVALISWLIGGLAMIVSAYTFSVMGTRYEKVNGIVDYAEALVGKKYAYFIGWFMATTYYPAMTSALAWVSGRYTMALFGYDANSSQTMTVAFFYLIVSFAINTISPKIAGKIQVSTTAVKLVPLLIMAVVGTVAGLKNGVLINNMGSTLNEAGELVRSSGINIKLILPGVCTSVFAYEGWIIATTINSEVKDSKKNLPRALIFGSIIVVAVYMLYYIGISGSIGTDRLLSEGGGALLAFRSLFGNVMGTLLTVFITVSCLGTLNGLTLACDRGFYSIAARNQGPRPEYLSTLDSASLMPSNASILALVVNGAWLVYFFFSALTDIPSSVGTVGKIMLFDSTELPLIAVYPFYIPIYIMFIARSKNLSLLKRIIMPFLSLGGAVLLIYAAITKHGLTNIGFLIVESIILITGAVFYKKDRKEPAAENDNG